MLITIDAFREDYYPASIEDAATIYNWFRENYRRETLVQTSDSYEISNIRFSEEEVLNAHPAKEVTLSVGKGSVVPVLPDRIDAPIQKGQKVGELLVYDYDILKERVDLISNQDVEKTFKGTIESYFYEATHEKLPLTIFVGLSIILLVLIILLIKRIKEK